MWPGEIHSQGRLAALRSSALDSTQACTLTRLTFCLWSYGALTSTGTMLAPSVLVRAIFSGSRGATSTGAVETVQKGHFSIRRRSASSIGYQQSSGGRSAGPVGVVG